MMKVMPEFVVETRALRATLDEDEQPRIERALLSADEKDISRKVVSAMRVGDVTACADDGGTNVLIAPLDGRAELRVTVRIASREMFRMGGITAAVSGVCLAIAPFAEDSIIHLVISTAALSALSFGMSWWSLRAAKKRVVQVADAVVAALPRVRFEDGEEIVEERVREQRAEQRRRAAP